MCKKDIGPTNTLANRWEERVYSPFQERARRRQMLCWLCQLNPGSRGKGCLVSPLTKAGTVRIHSCPGRRIHRRVGKPGSLPTSNFQGGRKMKLTRYLLWPRFPLLRPPTYSGRGGTRAPTEDSDDAVGPCSHSKERGRCGLWGQEMASYWAKENCSREHFSGRTGLVWRGWPWGQNQTSNPMEMLQYDRTWL